MDKEKMCMTIQEAIEQGYKQQQDKQLTENAKTVGNNFFDAQEAIRRAGTKRSELLKGIRNGVKPGILLATAADCIGLMTKDETYLPLVKQAIIDRFGQDALQPSLTDN